MGAWVVKDLVNFLSLMNIPYFFHRRGLSGRNGPHRLGVPVKTDTWIRAGEKPVDLYPV